MPGSLRAPFDIPYPEQLPPSLLIGCPDYPDCFFEILQRPLHIRRAVLRLIGPCGKTITWTEVMQKPPLAELGFIRFVHLLHLLRCQFPFFLPWFSSCPISPVMVFLHIDYLSIPEDILFPLYHIFLPLLALIGSIFNIFIKGEPGLFFPVFLDFFPLQRYTFLG